MRKSTPPPTQQAPVPEWAAEMYEQLRRNGVSLEIPRDEAGRTPTRYQCAQVLELSLQRMNEEIGADMVAARERRMKDPSLTITDVYTAYLRDGELVRWAFKRLVIPRSFGPTPIRQRRPASGNPISFQGRQTPPDVPEDHPAYDATIRLCQRGIFTGYRDGSFQGDCLLTRGEFVAAMYRVIQYLQIWNTDTVL